MTGVHQSSRAKRVPEKNKMRETPDFGDSKPLNREQERIREWLKQVHFKQTVFGGVEEADVWKKIAELNALYETALAAERARYDALLAERCGCAEPSHPTCSAGRREDNDAESK